MSHRDDIPRNKVHKGVSLVEMLIVIAVIGIFALIALPMITNAPASARESVAIETIERLNRSVNAYRMSSAIPLPATPGDELAVFAFLTTRDAKIRGTPFYSTKESLEMSADENSFRFQWNGTYFQMVQARHIRLGTNLARKLNPVIIR